MENVQKTEVWSGNDDQVEDGLECSLKLTPRIATTPFSSVTPKQTSTQITPPIHKPPFVSQEQPINASLNEFQTPPLSYQNQPIQLDLIYPMIMQFKKKFKLFNESQQAFAIGWESSIWKHKHKKKNIYCPQSFVGF